LLLVFISDVILIWASSVRWMFLDIVLTWLLRVFNFKSAYGSILAPYSVFGLCKYFFSIFIKNVCVVSCLLLLSLNCLHFVLLDKY
jgi:hypothetical protein